MTETVSGQMTISAPGASAEDVKSVVQLKLAEQFGVEPIYIVVTISESRRLQNAPYLTRRLAGTFGVTYKVKVAAAQADAVKAKSSELAKASSAMTFGSQVKAGLVTTMQAVGKDTQALEQSFAISGHNMNVDGQTVSVDDVAAPAPPPPAPAQAPVTGTGPVAPAPPGESNASFASTEGPSLLLCALTLMKVWLN